MENLIVPAKAPKEKAVAPHAEVLDLQDEGVEVLEAVLQLALPVLEEIEGQNDPQMEMEQGNRLNLMHRRRDDPRPALASRLLPLQDQDPLPLVNLIIGDAIQVKGNRG